MLPWLLTAVTRWSVEVLLTRKEGQVLGSEDRFHWARLMPTDGHLGIPDRHEEVVVFSSTVKSELMTLI